MATLGTAFAVRHASVTPNLYEGAVHRLFGVIVLGGLFVGTAHSTRASWQGRGQEYCQQHKTGASSAFVLLPTRDAEADGEEDNIDSARSSETLFHRLRSEVPRDMDTHAHLHDGEYGSDGRQSSTWQWVMRLMSSCQAVGLLVMVYVQILLGIATYCNLFTNHEIFNGLAHWVKASVFLLYGIWVSMRYFGFGSSLGHAWNLPSKTGRGIVSPEMIESGLIFTYGATDLFLERLGHADEPISHTDIQHISIALIFACAGLIGLLLESAAVKRLLLRASQTTREHRYPHAAGKDQENEERARGAFNVMPSLVVFFTGLLMSQHTQDSVFTTQLHATWGYYFCLAAVFRFITYCLTYSATATRLPARPPSELLVSFSLIAGALVFMMSSRDTAQSLEYYGIDLMFVISLSVAGSLLIMVWTLFLMILRSLNLSSTTSSNDGENKTCGSPAVL